MDDPFPRRAGLVSLEGAGETFFLFLGFCLSSEVGGGVGLLRGELLQLSCPSASSVFFQVEGRWRSS